MPWLLRAGKCISRWGGEEFLVIVPNVDAPGLQRVAERLRSAIADLLVAPVRPVTASFGTTMSRPGDDPETVLQRAFDRSTHTLYVTEAEGNLVGIPYP
ncbi:MAG TPA: diguanylate cyclase [Rhodanobacteraceae bacterium]